MNERGNIMNFSRPALDLGQNLQICSDGFLRRAGPLRTERG
jgi:hypothetical protein